MDRFGWTFDELDNQDEARLIPAVSAANVYSVLTRVLDWMHTAGAGMQVPAPTDADMQVWARVRQMQSERDNA